MSRLSKDKLKQLGDTLHGTCDEPTRVAEQLYGPGDYKDLEDDLLGINIEQCSMCGWWSESWELVDDEGDLDGMCEDCRKERGE